MLSIIIAGLAVVVVSVVLLRRPARPARPLAITDQHRQVLVGAAHGDHQLARLTDPLWRPFINDLMKANLLAFNKMNGKLYGVALTPDGLDHVTRAGWC